MFLKFQEQKWTITMLIQKILADSEMRGSWNEILQLNKTAFRLNDTHRCDISAIKLKDFFKC